MVDNEVDIKETVTFCKLVQLEDESYKSEEEYKPESEAESLSDIEHKRRKMNREAL